MIAHNRIVLARTAGVAVMAVALASALLAPGASAANGDVLSVARAATAGFHQVESASVAGYGAFSDTAGIACIANPGVGAMGIHYVNGGLVGDPAIAAQTPEALVYEPMPNGRLRLVAVEYIVTQAAWQGAGNTAPPTLFGRSFEVVDSPNRYGLPTFYELHAWIWRHNPRGIFDDWNPRVSCASA